MVEKWIARIVIASSLAASGTALLSGCGVTQWSNWLDDHDVEAEGHRPPNARAVLDLVRGQVARDRQVRAVGSGHSSSPVARPVDGQSWIDVGRIDEMQEWPFYQDGLDTKRYVRVGAGARIAEINEELAKRGRGLYNMGNYDQQTIAGAISTGTHGSGIEHGPLAERVVALELVTDERLEEPPGSKHFVRKQRLLRLERSQGLTSRARFDARGSDALPEGQALDQMVLEQNDAAFDAALIAFGTFGVIVSVTIDTRDRFFLREKEVVRFWDEQPADFLALAETHREFLMVQISPHRGRKGEAAGKLPYIVTKREEVLPCDAFDPLRPPSLETFGRAMGWATGTSFPEFLGRTHPAYSLDLIYKTWKQRARRTPAFESRSDRVHINSLAPHIHAASVDLWVPLERGRAAVNEIIRLAAEHENLCGQPAVVPAESRASSIEGCDEQSPALEDTYWHTSPLGIRVVGASRALLSPSYDGPRLSIEIPLLVDVRHNLDPEIRCKKEAYREKMFKTLTAALMTDEFDARPHWGHENWLTRAQAERIYGDNWTGWLQQYRRFNGFGTFDNAFTDQLCISGGGSACGAPPPDECQQP